MKRFFKEMYEAPTAEVLAVKMEMNLLTSVQGVSSSRGDTYGVAVEENWE